MTKPYKFTLPQGQRDVHESYGLYVWSYWKAGRTPAREGIHPRLLDFYGISHLIKGQGFYWTADDNRTEKFKAGQGLMLTPGKEMYFGGDKGDYIEDALCFSGPIADHLYETGIIKDGIINIGSSRRLLPIMELCADPSRDSQIKANLALQNLLVELYLENKNEVKSTNRDKIDHLVKAMQKDFQKWWTVPEMAEFCHLSERQFRQVFEQHTGHGPKAFLDMIKMEKASEYLLHTDYSIEKISQLVGYAKSNHFSRRFKEIKEVSPKQFRQNFRLG